MLYFLAWIYFDLIKAGELVALSTLELALNDRYGDMVKKRGGYRPFAGLLKHMLQDGLTDDKIPLIVEISRGEADINVVVKDILALTKLNYNTCIFGDGMPITLKFADAVGEILTAGPIKDVPPLPFGHYI